MSARIDNDILKPYIGEIVCGSTHYGCTTPYFYRIVKLIGKKTVLLQGMDIVYDSQYGPNSPLYECIPVECVDMFPDRKWYDIGRHWRSGEQLKAFVYKWGTEGDPQDPVKYAIYSQNSPLMWLWDKTIQYGNCD